MATLTYAITATNTEFNNFADRLGYQQEVLVAGIPAANPEARREYISRLMREAQDRLFFTPFVNEIDQQIRDAREAEKEVMKTNIRNRSTINYVA